MQEFDESAVIANNNSGGGQIGVNGVANPNIVLSKAVPYHGNGVGNAALVPIQDFPAQSSCHPNPCQNSGTCHEFDSGRNYKCICPVGFDGSHCQGKLNHFVYSQLYNQSEDYSNFFEEWRFKRFDLNV